MAEGGQLSRLVFRKFSVELVFILNDGLQQ